MNLNVSTKKFKISKIVTVKHLWQIISCIENYVKENWTSPMLPIPTPMYALAKAVLLSLVSPCTRDINTIPRRQKIALKFLSENPDV